MTLVFVIPWLPGGYGEYMKHNPEGSCCALAVKKEQNDRWFSRFLSISLMMCLATWGYFGEKNTGIG